MKKRIVYLVCGLMLSLSMAQAERVMVISDPHVIASSLLQPGAAADEMLASGRKMLDLSEPAFRALIDTALLYRPELVLIPGDLTKDGEKVSHELVAAQLARLTEAGIPVLVIPGNHDIANPASYAYNGDQKTKVANITDAEFDAIYAAYMPQASTARDSESHSYVTEPLRGVTVLAIDGVHGNAGTGSLSDKTLNWLLAQADAAVAKGNMVLAMCHWQLIEHVDNQTMVLSSSQLAHGDSIAQLLAQHKVHVVLTGHFHINGVTTKYYGTLNDSIVEISTGSPVAYPCPYRWLEISADRSTISVTTDEIRALGTITDMHAYSRAWQQEATRNMGPDAARRAWRKVDAYLAQMESSSNLTMKAFAVLLKARIPQDDSTRVALFEKHMGQSMVDLYILHSDANENTRPEKDAIVNAFYDNLQNFMIEVLGEDLLNHPVYGVMVGPMVELAMNMVSASITSLTEDITTGDNPEYEDRTDDLYPVLRVNEPLEVSHEGLETVEAENHHATYDVLGRPVQNPAPGQIVIRNKTKQVTK